jgi:hypothetical protein
MLDGEGSGTALEDIVVVKFGLASMTGRTVVGIGLSRKNTERLLAGQPIHVKAEDWSGPREHAKRLIGIERSWHSSTWRSDWRRSQHEQAYATH